MKKKILLGAVIIVGVAALVAGVTTALFSDTEVSTGNTFTAGKLNLKIDNTCHYNGMVCTAGVWAEESQGSSDYPELIGETCACSWQAKDLDNELFFNFDDVKPGDYGEDTISLHVDNNDAWVCAMLSNLQSNDNGCEQPESDIDQSCGVGQGELQSNLFLTIWRDTDCDNVLALPIPAVPEVPAHCGGGSNPSYVQFCASDGENQEICQMDSWAGCVWIPLQPAVPAVAGEQVLVNNLPVSSNLWPIADVTTGGVPLAGGSNYCLGISWNVPLATNNIIQSDSVQGDVQFYAVQSRHNQEFSCASAFAEVCDGIDNDFDGVIDDGGVCWVSPTSNNDASLWRDEPYGRDRETNFAAVTEFLPYQVWSDTMTYYFNPTVPSSKLKFHSSGNWGSNIEIKAIVDGVSQLVYSGAPGYGWLEIPLNPTGVVSQLDIRGTNALQTEGSVMTLLHDIQILRTP
jgi:predicted ribosomally synthesized peptide with SipW-like signal peptide